MTGFQRGLEAACEAVEEDSSTVWNEDGRYIRVDRAIAAIRAIQPPATATDEELVERALAAAEEAESAYATAKTADFMGKTPHGQRRAGVLAAIAVVVREHNPALDKP